MEEDTTEDVGRVTDVDRKDIEAEVTAILKESVEEPKDWPAPDGGCLRHRRFQ